MTDVATTEAGLIVALDVLDDVLDPFRREVDPLFGDGVPAHVTVLFPLGRFVDLPTLDDRLDDLASRHTPFEVAFTRVGWFGERVLWLHPEPVDRFRALVGDAARTFPEHPPYEGEFAVDDVIPHLTIGTDAPAERLHAVAETVTPLLPLRATVDRLTVVGRPGAERWRTVRELPLTE